MLWTEQNRKPKVAWSDGNGSIGEHKHMLKAERTLRYSNQDKDLS